MTLLKGAAIGISYFMLLLTVSGLVLALGFLLL